MTKITKIVGIDNKYGRKSRTGSNISIGVDDLIALDAQSYLMSLEKGEKPKGNIKKIELIISYVDDMEEVDTIESLERQIQELTACLEDVTTVVDSKAVGKVLASNQPDLDIYSKKCECDNRVISNGKCCNCGGFE